VLLRDNASSWERDIEQSAVILVAGAFRIDSI
jgi:hypothetical protein